MHIQKSALGHALPKCIGVTVFCAVVIAFGLYFELPKPLIYFIIAIPMILALMFWIGGIREVLNGGQWLLNITEDRIQIETPSEFFLDLALEEIEYLGFSKSGNEKGAMSQSYWIFPHEGEEILLPRDAPWTSYQIKKVLMKQGVEYRRIN